MESEERKYMEATRTPNVRIAKACGNCRFWKREDKYNQYGKCELNRLSMDALVVCDVFRLKMVF